MDIVVIFNGLGNQMSQYAFYLAKKRQNKRCKPFFAPTSHNNHNGSELNRVFNIKYPNIGTRLFIYIYYRIGNKNKIAPLLGTKIYKEPLNYDFRSELLSKGTSLINFYKGGWHSEMYFKDIEDELRSTFRFNIENEKEEVFINWKKLIESTHDSVSLHIRRGDYLKQPSNSFYQFSDVATLDYYKKAIVYIKERRDDCQFFIFSDDLEWCRQYFIGEEFHFVDGNTELKTWRDMYLMTLCQDHINANSSFSWWGAWLSNIKEGITIRPKWFIRNVETKDFYPKNWIEI